MAEQWYRPEPVLDCARCRRLGHAGGWRAFARTVGAAVLALVFSAGIIYIAALVQLAPRCIP